MRYMLFAGDTYYAKGGVHDLVNRSDSLPNLKIATETFNEVYDWWHIYDTWEGCIVTGSHW